MIRFKAVIKKFGNQGEKTGWFYIEVPAEIAQKLVPGNKKAFRVKGKLDSYAYEKLAIMPMGDGAFIMALKAEIRKSIRKSVGDTIDVRMEVDKNEIKPPAELIECLEDEPEAMAFYKSLTKGHQNYFTQWIDSAKTEPTRAKRIAQAVNAFIKKQGYGEMIRAAKKEKEDFGF